MIIVRIAGGLGNQMFEYSLARWLQLQGKEVKLDVSLYDAPNRGPADGLHQGYELHKLFGCDIPVANRREINRCSRYMHSYVSRTLNRLVGTKKTHITREKLGGNRWYLPDELRALDNVYLDGYWCSYAYAEDIAETLRPLLAFPPLTDRQNQTLADLIRGTDAVSIHVRRGDYLKLADRYVILDEDYYARAISQIEQIAPRAEYFCFSDDIAWCREHLRAEHIRFIDWNIGKDSFRDMQLMAMCRHHICANSTFSTWAAWLDPNPDKRVICPRSMFVNPAYMSEDMYPNHWTLI